MRNRNIFYNTQDVRLYIVVAFVLGFTIGFLPPYVLGRASSPQQDPISPATVLCFTAPTQPTTYAIPLSQEHQDLITNLCEDKPFTPEVIYSIIFVESRFIPTAHNPNSDCYGLMQVNKRYFRHWLSSYAGVITPAQEDILNPTQNIIAGVNALNEWRLICEAKGYYEVKDWLEAYNKGYTFFSMSNPTYSYANEVFKYMETLEKI